MRICTFNSCTNKHDSHGYCANHARQFRKFGHPLSVEEKHEIHSKASTKRLLKFYRENPNRPKRTWSEAKRLAAKGRRLNTGRTHFTKGFTPWNKGSKGMVTAWNKGINTGLTPWNKGLFGYNAGAKNPNWKDGAYTKNYRIRRSRRYAEWRKSVFERDDYTCQHCQARGVYIEADHIKPFAFFPELRFEINNGRTLCKECHMNTPTYKKHKLVEVAS